MTCCLTARWPGKPPRIGHFLKAPRGRTAYEIVTVRKRRPTRPRRYNLLLTCVRHLASDVPPGATVHAWRWDKRCRRN